MPRSTTAGERARAALGAMPAAGRRAQAMRQRRQILIGYEAEGERVRTRQKTLDRRQASKGHVWPSRLLQFHVLTYALIDQLG
jgi:hypothetical protein